ncbi:hypothetical protein BO82DRAFT_399049 [Aspergillus uvarum CBS 121591]|uniref:Uncharacterized protein n=1 Tax=Aspergillus uvarum CBS 121591 TaxID=1448315 RepID=A0A319CM58_9EURO|nr:hypothetical protein BO82DRAFT_399049 [Aspergillus uvarum CBS 121591]PYH85101.1 hypothetical protein BO82DRAFT_399049 [Aspergillus uvarum CBS 121591]
MPSTASRQRKYATIVAASVGYAAMQLIMTAANLSGISGGQIFRTDDAPLYRHGLTALCALAGAAWVQEVGLNV